MTPPPAGRHEHCLAKIIAQMYRHGLDKSYGLGHKGLVVPSRPGSPMSHVIPDMTFVPDDRRVFEGEKPWSPVEPGTVTMTVEVTWTRPDLDREAKRHGYARAGIPLYLLVDREERKTILFGRPGGDDYRRADWAPFGEPLALPEPFGIDLDTSEFG